MGYRKITSLLFLFLVALPLSAAHIHDLRCDFLSDPLGIDRRDPVFGWKLEDCLKGDRQVRCRILVASSLENLDRDNGDLWDSGRIRLRDQVAVKYSGRPLSSGSLAYWKVKIWTRKGGETEWSDAARFSVGLLEPSDWEGRFICLDSETDSPMFLKSFSVDRRDGTYLLHVNSLGYHEIYLNGSRIGDALLQPAVSQADKRSLICTYDLTDRIVEGNNDLVVWISEGWNRAYEDKLCDHPAVRVQMQQIVPGAVTVDLLNSDETWLARESGWHVSGTWRPFTFGGDVADARCMLPDLSASSLRGAVWNKAVLAAAKPHEASPQMVEPCRIMRTVAPVSVASLGKDSWLVDFGTCLTGILEIGFPSLRRGCRVEMDYADCLDSDDTFPVVRRGDFKDVYIASGSGNERFSGRFDYHGFRYVRIDGIPSAPVEVRAHLVRSAFGGHSSFESSDSDLNAIHDMIHYTVECLTPGGYMIDCPHIERLGYGGDGNASTPTLQTMFDTAPLVYNWAQAWADAQREDGGMPHTAPAPYGAGGGPFWCGFLIVASWQSYVRFGDDRLIVRFYPQMKKWMEYVAEYSPGGMLDRWPDDPIRRKYYLGDWAAPEKVNVSDSSSVKLVNNCFITECLETMARISEYNHERNLSRHYRREARQLRKDIHRTFYSDSSATYATGSQIDMCYPMLVGVTPGEEVLRVEQTLADSIRCKYDGNLAAGLVGVPVITRWATAACKADLMYSMLKKRTYPGYLYMIDHGATTTWEYWNGYRSHIHNCYNGVGSWFYEALGGILSDDTAPGFRHFTVKPQVVEGVDHVKVSESTPLGCITSEWERHDGTLTVRISVPFGAKATLVLPGGSSPRKLSSGEHEFTIKY